MAVGPSRRGFSEQSGARQLIRDRRTALASLEKGHRRAYRFVEQVLANRCQRRVFHHLDLVLCKERTSICDEDVGIGKVDVP